MPTSKSNDKHQQGKDSGKAATGKRASGSERTSGTRTPTASAGEKNDSKGRSGGAPGSAGHKR